MESKAPSSACELHLDKQIRKETLDLAIETNNGHIASALSIVEILIALYEYTLKPNDIFILSKGHGCLSWYAMLRKKGFNPDVTKGHPDIDKDNGIVCTTGSLGHGLPIGVGIALANKLKKESGNVYVLVGDGEMSEGSIWESLLVASHHNLDNLTVVVDRNQFQALGKTENILSLESLSNKILAFECEYSMVDGHNIGRLIREFQQKQYSPKVIIANTIKGKGISFMEGIAMWHNRLPDKSQLKKAYKELE